MERPSRRTQPRKKTGYSVGEVNALIDDFCHPLTKIDKRFLLLDTLLHFLNERDIPLFIKKLIKYNLPKIIEELNKDE